MFSHLPEPLGVRVGCSLVTLMFTTKEVAVSWKFVDLEIVGCVDLRPPKVELQHVVLGKVGVGL